MAFRVRGEPTDADGYAASFEGSLTNQSDQACAYAIYRFDVPPARADIVPVVVGETPPSTIAGGGRLLDDGVLPASAAQLFEVPVERIRIASYFEPEVDATIVVVFCSEANVDIDIDVELLVCADGDDAPPQPPHLMEQLW